MVLGGELVIGEILWIRKNSKDKNLVEIALNNNGRELILQVTGDQLEALNITIRKFSETGLPTRVEGAHINDEAGFVVHTSIFNEKGSISMGTEAPEWDFDEKAGFILEFTDSRGNCSNFVFDIEQMRKIRDLQDSLIRKHDLFVEAKKELIQRITV